MPGPESAQPLLVPDEASTRARAKHQLAAGGGRVRQGESLGRRHRTSHCLHEIALETQPRASYLCLSSSKSVPFQSLQPLLFLTLTPSQPASRRSALLRRAAVWTSTRPRLNRSPSTTDNGQLASRTPSTASLTQPWTLAAAAPPLAAAPRPPTRRSRRWATSPSCLAICP